MKYQRWLVCGLLFLLPACGGNSSGSGGSTGGSTASGGSTGGSTASGGTGTGGGTGGTTTSSTVGPTGCPLVEPQGGATCTINDLRCTYGDSPVPSCRKGYRCSGGVWSTDGPGCDTAPPTCPTDPEGSECQVQPQVCVLDALFCVCGPCGGAGCPDPPWFWACGGQPNTGCPDTIGNDGAACDMPALECHYGVFCAEEATATCTDGAWKWAPAVACP